MRVLNLGYIGIESPNSDAWKDFGPSILGAPSECDDNGRISLRIDNRHHRIAIYPGVRNRLAYLGWEMTNRQEWEAGVEHLRRDGYSVSVGDEEMCAERGVSAVASVTDPNGYTHEVFVGQVVIPGAFVPARPITGFVTGEQGLGHVVITGPRGDKEAAFLTSQLGLLPSDDIYIPGLSASFFHARSRHHSLGFDTSSERLFNHFMLECRSLTDVGLTYDLCKSRGVPIVRSLGQPPNDLMFSFYMLSPSGFEIEYGWGGLTVEEPWAVSRYESMSIWGHDFTPPPSDTQFAAP